ncbi:conserved hypothetical protein [Rippkaea orientalis PCC 8801]|uniref:DUF697 domain-containing protein n=1 Tax=Rippkaea orientalis (strain PCC 8801 / RF-1) TaxID=41431 RepID=B7K3Z5_RIPO1|nr:YcjF family protein [Rippkaea orientalis]ACK66535.1 conserved hypothetical protein [Rippkaea orientalis PCC 8801]
MAMIVKKPILVAGIGISFVLWLGESLHQELVNVGEWGVISAIAMGSGFWWWKNRHKSDNKPQKVPSLTLETVKASITEVETTLQVLATESPESDLSEFKQQLNQLSTSFERQDLNIAITGGKNVGKTTLLKVLKPKNIANNISFIETEPLFINTETPQINADIIIFLITGDLTNSQWEFLQNCYQNYQRCVLVFNKQDQYIPEERGLILSQIQQRITPIINTIDIISISSGSYNVKVRQHQADGTIKEWNETQDPDVKLLCDRLKFILNKERELLVLGTIWREAKTLKQTIKNQLNLVRRERAIPIIEQYQWIAAATAFANPVAALDLLATVAISTQMVVDLSEVYQQKFSLEQGQTLAGTMGKLMVQLGLVELSTNTIAGLLKSNAVTYIAGGTVQGISAAYLTRLAGLSLIEYWEEQDIINSSKNAIDLEKFSTKLKEVFNQNQRGILLQNFVKQGMVRFT